MSDEIDISPAVLHELDWLAELEAETFGVEAISRRSMRRFLSGEQNIFLVAWHEDTPVGYLLIIFRRGTRLARLYSHVTTPAWRSRGIGEKLLAEGEREAWERGVLYLRLEVEQFNHELQRLYQHLGFKDLRLLPDFYQDHSPAVLMQKRIQSAGSHAMHIRLPWYTQQTPFTCGPAALMMAMAGLDDSFVPSLNMELQLWRETTTIFMTSGHGGCHPLGLALAAFRRGFPVTAWVNKRGPLFLEGVRSESKKKVMRIVHEDFAAQVRDSGVALLHRAISQQALRDACDQGAIALVLISTYRFDRQKAPHWVVVSGYDEKCFYLHDPDDDETASAMDMQYIPIAIDDFDSMSSFGGSRLRCAVLIHPKTA